MDIIEKVRNYGASSGMSGFILTRSGAREITHEIAILENVIFDLARGLRQEQLG